MKKGKHPKAGRKAGYDFATMEGGVRGRYAAPPRTGTRKVSALRGVKFLTDDDGERTAVVIDLKRNAQLWEDLCDIALARSRAKEPRESLDSVKRRISLRPKRR